MNRAPMASPKHRTPRHWAGTGKGRRDGGRTRGRRRRGRGGVVVIVLVLLLVAGLGAWTWKNDGYLFGYATPLAAEDYEGPGGQDVQVEIPEGARGAVIGQVLVENGVVASLGAFNHAYGANPEAVGIQPGLHSLKVGMSARDAVAALVANEIDRGGLTIPEGYVVAQVKQTMIDKGWPAEQVEKAFSDPGAVGLPGVADGEFEGWLFPNTYDVRPENDPAPEVVREMIAQTVAVLQDVDVPGPRREEILVKASLIEREAAHDEDRPLMAAAIENRLAADEPLGIDASLLYGLGRTSGGLTSEELADGSNPYNLSIHGSKGLPPTPIASPGRASIDAAMHPADDKDVFFWCTVNLASGETKFATTLADHEKNVAELNAWLAEHPEFG